MIAVVMTTYAPEGDAGASRIGYARQTAQALAGHLDAPEPLRLIVSDDGSTQQGWQKKLTDKVKHWQGPNIALSGQHQGIGHSLNAALAEIGPDDLWMYITDDWVLTDRMDLGQAVRLIRHHGYDYVRLGPIHPNLACHSRYEVGTEYWLDIDPTPGGFAFATRPFLATKGFWNKIGRFMEHADAYDTEQDYAIRVMHAGARVKLAQADYGLVGPWRHIGDVEVGKMKI
jgi:glycosyltransferase involved in cell wall biosynthesis